MSHAGQNTGRAICGETEHSLSLGFPRKIPSYWTSLCSHTPCPIYHLHSLSLSRTTVKSIWLSPPGPLWQSHRSSQASPSQSLINAILSRLLISNRCSPGLSGQPRGYKCHQQIIILSTMLLSPFSTRLRPPSFMVEILLLQDNSHLALKTRLYVNSFYSWIWVEKSQDHLALLNCN